LELPAINPMASRLQAMAADDDFDIKEVENLILTDQVLAAEVLRAANSAFFGGLAPIGTIRAAVIRLSVQQVARLIYLVSERSKYSARDAQVHRRLQNLWRHSSAVAKGSHWLARRLNFKNLEDTVFLGGLLHDVGQLVILRALDEIKLKEDSPFDVSSNLVQEVLMSAHTGLGYELLKDWNIPETYCLIARDHHGEEYDASDFALGIVRLANMTASRLGLSLHPDPSLVLGDLPEAHSLGANEILLAELEIMLEDAAQNPDSPGIPRPSGRKELSGFSRS
jgi:putative nucleotidyltransferase with HDIG domain